MQITITDEQTKWLLKTVAWQKATETLGNFEDELYVSAVRTEAEYQETRSKATTRFQGYGEFLAMTERLERAELGEVFEIPEAMRETLEYWSNEAVVAVHGNPARWNPEAIERLEWVYPAAIRVAAELRTALAVA